MKTSSGVEFTYRKKDEEFYILDFIYDKKAVSLEYKKYFPVLKTDMDKLVEITRMGFLINKYIKQQTFQKEIKKYVNRK